MNMRGSLPLLVLHVLSRGPRHGYRIAQEIKQESEGVLDFREGSLYPTLHKLEEDGLLETYTEEEKGRTRRYYRLTGTGQAMLAQERLAWDRYRQAVNLVLEATP